MNSITAINLETKKQFTKVFDNFGEQRRYLLRAKHSKKIWVIDIQCEPYQLDYLPM